jgi:NADH:ubiquinone oxidoreductase subunit 2 (subunit N)
MSLDWVASHGQTVAPIAAALVAAAILLAAERAGHRGFGPVAVLLALTWGLAMPGQTGAFHAPLTVGLVIAGLARDREDLLHGECALKLVWVMGSALALSWAGLELLTLATGTDVAIEQWAVLSLGLEPRFLWSTALPLSLLLGFVMLGGAPLHFWVGDVLQGARPWLAPIAVAAIQVGGASWLSIRLSSIDRYQEGAQLAQGVLHAGALVALLTGAATLAVQRRPERRVATLASLNGALVLTRLASGHPLDAAWLDAWRAHLTLALVGAVTLARFLPVSSSVQGRAAPLARRHPVAAVAGFLSLASLAGFPGLPGASLWLEVARSLARSQATGLLLALGITWLTALAVVLRQLREAYGTPAPRSTVVRAVPRTPRAALAIVGLAIVGLVALALRSS